MLTPDKILNAVLSVAIAVIGFFLADAHTQLRAQQQGLVELRIAQQTLVTRDLLDKSVREIRDDVTQQIRLLREDLPGIVRAAVRERKDR